MMTGLGFTSRTCPLLYTVPKIINMFKTLFCLISKERSTALNFIVQEIIWNSYKDQYDDEKGMTKCEQFKLHVFVRV